jgi:hypothetical protein
MGSSKQTRGIALLVSTEYFKDVLALLITDPALFSLPVAAKVIIENNGIEGLVIRELSNT